MIAGFTIKYAFDVGELLSRELRDRAIAKYKPFLAYPCMITQLCLVEGVLEILGFDEMIEAQKTFGIRLIQ